MSHFVRVLTHDFSLDRVAVSRNILAPEDEMVRKAPVTIGDASFIGIGATIMPGVSIGEGSIVGAGSVVTKDVAAGVVVAGNPAVHICTTTEYWARSEGKFSVQKRRK